MLPNTPARRPSFTRHAALAMTMAAALWVTAAQAAPTVSKFEPTAEVLGTKLQINGQGTRRRGIFNGYDMALYTTRKVATVDDLLALPGPKKLQFVALRDLPGTELGRLFIKGMGENSPKELTQKHSLSSLRLIEIFSGRPKVAPGETFAMEFIPGKGTLFYILGKPQGEPVGDAEFFTMVLKIWVGPQPADTLLKEALLGKE
ncbi:chalcone isomerase family protein [Piscinibacter gummiphilus]|uniref:Uncharacterized protein n=1 Tax=Piscinibacter gummiphilus TaxID=946333 RepID=A0A1W6LG99_9BURK|nr:chalcone isomerase family protein [Piscinibacter gummiphilus]ARN23240.1 hypothetical protein A4W93_26900 [Piscinibacter gummiphilus]ATU67941.1 hypothetical protein CPZ87_27030 [Piscinibacter gummiphilus]GLS97230.1 hypothetical protein GCM10007918_45220 [Piscinibacter gummiphilus]